MSYARGGAISDVGRDASGGEISQIGSDDRMQSEMEEREPETFLSQVTKHTQKIIDDERLDNLGYEEDNNNVLDPWLDNQKIKQEGVPLSGLIAKVKEVAGLMPILKKVNSKQIYMEMNLTRFEA